MTPFKNINRVTSAYGYREYWNKGKLVKETHRGIDVVATPRSGAVVAEKDWEVREVTGGTVIKIAYDNSRGHYVDVRTSPTTFERYQHLQAIYVKVGESVPQGKVIALAGNSGNSTGRHLHFGVYKNGSAESNAIAPQAWLGLPNKAGTYQGNNNVDKPTASTPQPVPKMYSFTAKPVSTGDKNAFEKLAKELKTDFEIKEV